MAHGPAADAGAFPADDEFDEVARVAGIAELRRGSVLPAHDVRAVARRDCADRGVPFEQANLVVAHLGGGASVVAVRAGRLVDATDPDQEGPFATERCGGLPVGQLAALIREGRFADEAELRRALTRDGGVRAYLGTADLTEVERRIADGDGQAAEVLDAMAYQLGKAIGAHAAVLAGRVDAVLLTGPGARCERLLTTVRPMIEWIAPVRVHPDGGAAPRVEGDA